MPCLRWKRIIARFGLCLLASLWAPLALAQQKLAVLELVDEAPLSGVELRILADAARKAALALPRDGLLVLTRESMEALVPPGTRLDECAAEGCEVVLGRRLGVELVLSGSVARLGGALRADFKLHDTGTGQLLEAETARGASFDALEADVQHTAERMLQRALRRPGPRGPGAPGGGEAKDSEAELDAYAAEQAARIERMRAQRAPSPPRRGEAVAPTPARLGDGAVLELALGVGQQDKAANAQDAAPGAAALGLGVGFYPHASWFTAVQLDTRFATVNSGRVVSEVPRLTDLTSLGLGLSLVTRFVPFEAGFSPTLGLRLGAVIRFLFMESVGTETDIPWGVDARQLGVSLAPAVGFQWAGAPGGTPLAVFFELSYETTAWGSLTEDAFFDDTVGTAAEVEARLDPKAQVVFGTLGVRFGL